MLLHNLFSALEGIDHSLDVQEFASYPDVALCEGVLVCRSSLSNLLLEVSLTRVGQSSLLNVTFGKVVNSNFLEFHECIVHILIVFITRLELGLANSNQIRVSLHRQHSLAQKSIELVDLLAVLNQN
jgi:hypothetical protein